MNELFLSVYFLSSAFKAYEVGWPVFMLAVSSSHGQCAASVLIIAELVGVQLEQNSLTKFLSFRG